MDSPLGSLSFALFPQYRLAIVSLFVIGAGMVLYQAAPTFTRDVFWFWIIFYYLATLALECALVLSRPLPTNRAEKP